MRANIKGTVLLSGGIDSAACARFMSARMRVDCLFIDFGQAAAKAELKAAQAIASHLSLPFECATVRASTKFAAGEIVGRNAFLVLSAVLIRGKESNVIGCGIHAGTTYSDCSPTFVDDINRL